MWLFACDTPSKSHKKWLQYCEIQKIFLAHLGRKNGWESLHIYFVPFEPAGRIGAPEPTSDRSDFIDLQIFFEVPVSEAGINDAIVGDAAAINAAGAATAGRW